MIKIPRGWMTALSQKPNKKTLFKQYVKNGKIAHDYENLQFAKTELLDYMIERKNEYNLQLSQSLNNPATSAKTYWAILKTFNSTIPTKRPTHNWFSKKD